MIIGKEYELGLWTCVKDKAFINNRKTSSFFLKQILLYLTKENRGEKV